MWNAFKNFLKDFSRLDKAEIPSIILWEHYLVYAVSLGVAKEVIKQLPIVFTDDDLNNTSLHICMEQVMVTLVAFGTMFDDTINTVRVQFPQRKALQVLKIFIFWWWWWF